MRSYYVYIITYRKRTVLYTGITSDLLRRLIEHYLSRGKQKTFAGRYQCHHLLFYEEFQFADEAIAREKEIKRKSRKWKNELISKENPDWCSFNYRFFDSWPPDETLIQFF